MVEMINFILFFTTSEKKKKNFPCTASLRSRKSHGVYTFSLSPPFTGEETEDQRLKMHPGFLTPRLVLFTSISSYHPESRGVEQPQGGGAHLHFIAHFHTCQGPS